MSVTGPTGATATYTWDAQNQPLTVTDPRQLDVPYGLDWAEREEWLH